MTIINSIRFQTEKRQAKVLLDLISEIMGEMGYLLIPPKELEEVRYYSFKLASSYRNKSGWTIQPDGFRPNDILILKLWILLRRMDAIEVQGNNKKSTKLLRLQERFGREYGIGLFWEGVKV